MTGILSHQARILLLIYWAFAYVEWAANLVTSWMSISVLLMANFCPRASPS